MSRRPPPSTHLRVGGGEVGGRRLSAPRGIRPTAGLVREAIFNVVVPVLADAAVLDLFAGSGALGIEALSRGAASATFVDQDEHAVRVVRQNLEALGLTGRGRAVRAEVTRWLTTNPEEVQRASLVLLDPPYNDAVLAHALALLDSLVSAGATVVAEHFHRQPLPDLRRLRSGRERRYGDTGVSVLVAE
ncbi:MAG TPA: 16S rRNA (guanine(966)-N(2))-methyltransferase RsmD [Terriglobales bacterium]|nr:16S rRNA (guanine(966)-N(2))-methyltransferase RsmD [Terriglobales bacterium]